MIILNSKNSTILRVPKTGSTSFEASIRFAPGLTQPGDFVTAVDDANLIERGTPQALDDMRTARAALVESIRSKKDLEEPNYTQEEQDFIDFRQAQRENDTFEYIPLPHSTLEDIVNPDTWGPAGLITDQQISNYTHYAFIRNPLKRALSCFLFMKTVRQNYREFIRMSDFHDVVLKPRSEPGSMRGLVYRQQIDYFKYQGSIIVTPLLFENYTQSLDWVITQLGVNPLNEYPRFKNSEAAKLRILDGPANVENWIEPYPTIKQAILNRYSEDVTLWEQTSGQTL